MAVKLDSKLTATKIETTVETATKAALDKVHDIAKETIENVKSFNVVSKIEGIGKKVSDTLSNIKTSVSEVATNLGNKVSETANDIKKTAVNFASTVKDKWQNLKEGVRGFTKQTKDFVCNLGTKIVDNITGTFNKFKEVAKTAIAYIKDKKDIILDTLKKVGIKLLDGTQFILDILGLIPGFGELADGVNGIIYTLRGDALNAALSFAACIPFAGWAATGGKIVGKLAKIGDVSKFIDRAKDFAKYFDKVKDLGKAAMKYGDNVISFISKKGDDIWTFISKNKVVDKATELVSKINKVGYDLQEKLIKQVDKISISFGEWWVKQQRVYAVHPDIADIINFKEKVTKNLGKSKIKEMTEEAGEKLASAAIEKQVQKEIKEGTVEKSANRLDNITEKVTKPKLESNPFDENGKLKPSIRYKAGEYDYLYETDELGRISKFETDNLQLTKRESRLPHNPNTPGKEIGDHAGHLAGDRFGGSPELDNLVSQSSNVNLSQYKRLENKWANAIKEGKQVKVDVNVKYDGDSLRPVEFKVKYEIDGKYYEKDIINKVGDKKNG